MFEIFGPFFFGAASNFKDAIIGAVEKPPKVLVLRIRHVLTMDVKALRTLEDVVVRARRDRTHLVLSDVHAQPLVLLETGLVGIMGADNMTGNPDSALNRARPVGAAAGGNAGRLPPTVARERIRPESS